MSNKYPVWPGFLTSHGARETEAPNNSPLIFLEMKMMCSISEDNTCTSTSAATPVTQAQRVINCL